MVSEELDSIVFSVCVIQLWWCLPRRIVFRISYRDKDLFWVLSNGSWLMVFFLFLNFLSEYRWFTVLFQFLLYNIVTQTYIYTFSHIIFHHHLCQETEYSSLCCTVGAHSLFILNIIVCIYQLHSPHPYHFLCHPLATTSLFSMSLSLFSLFTKY